MLKKLVLAVLKMAKEYVKGLVKSWLKNKVKKVVLIVGAAFALLVLLIVFL